MDAWHRDGMGWDDNGDGGGDDNDLKSHVAYRF